MSCDRSNELLCVERICFNLSLNTTVRNHEAKHTILPENSPGWIDVQKFTPLQSATGTIAEVSAQLAQRIALAPATQILSHSTATLPQMQREVATNELTLRWRGTEFRRRSWLVVGDATHPWMLIDVTAPSARWSEAEQSLVPIVLAMRPLQPAT